MGALRNGSVPKDEQTQRLIAILDGMPDACCALNRNYQLTFFNERCARYFGVRREKVIGMTLATLGVTTPAVVEAAIQAAMQGEPREAEFVSPHSGLLIQLRAFPLPDGCAVVFSDLGPRRKLEAEVAARAAELATLYETAPVGLGLLDRELRYLRVNAALAEINGVPAEEHIGRTLEEILPGVVDGVREPFLRVLETGVAIHDLEIQGVTPADPGRLRSWLENIAPVEDAAGQVHAILVSVIEITARKEAEDRTRLLLQELNHRVKNSLATVQSIAMQTYRTQPDPSEFIAAFTERLVALSRTHNVLARHNWRGASLSDLLAGEFAPYGGGEKARIDGADVVLTAPAALSLGLVLHELVTNAAKFGALSSPRGRLQVSWRQEADELMLYWLETGGPPVSPPQSRGFGSRLIQRSIVGDLRGRMDMQYRPDGLNCVIAIPAAANLE